MPTSARITPESAVLNASIRWLWAHGCFIWRNNTGRNKNIYKRKDGSIGESWIRYGLPGSGDIIGLTRSGKFISIECKSSKGRSQDHQEQFGERVRQNNGIYAVVRSLDDLEAIKGQLV